MQKKKLLAGVTALAIAAVIIPSSYAFGGFGGPKDGGKNFDPEKHEAVMEALESQDYDAFVEARLDVALCAAGRFVETQHSIVGRQ